MGKAIERKAMRRFADGEYKTMNNENKKAQESPGREASDHISDLLSCNFCKKTEKQVAVLIAAGNCGICSECVMTCNSILEEKLKNGRDAILKIHDFAR